MNFKKPKFWDSPGLSFWSSVLYPLSIIFLITSQLLNIFKSKKKFPIPIICIGNIYLGGTGKTPLALEIFKIIKSLGKNPAFVKKGYEYLYDEIKMLGKVGKTFSDRNRTTSINSLVSSGYDVAILDDGFQDISIAKDFSILCFTSNQWIGNGFVIPSGPLRERIESIKKADCIVINGENNKSINEKIKKINNNIKKGFPIFLKKAFPLTIITILAYVIALFFLNNYNELDETIYKVMFIGLASLTFPHILLEYLLEKNAK